MKMLYQFRIIIVLFLLISGFDNSFASEGSGRVIGGNANEVRILRVSEDDVLYAGIWGDGLYRSLDKGVNFSKITNGITGKYINYISFFGTNTILISTADAGIFISTNGGAAFTPTNAGLVRLNSKVVIAKTADTLFAGTYGDGFFMSVDGGANWIQKNPALNYQDINDICVTKTGRIIVGTYGGGIYKSDDNAQTFSRNVGGITLKYSNRIFKLKNDKIVIVGQNSGVYLSEDNGQSFFENVVTLDSELKDRNIMDVVFANPNLPSIVEEPVVATRYRGIFYYDSRVYQDWRQASVFSGGVNSIVKLKDGTLLAAIPARGIVKSTNNGKDWTINSLWSGDKILKLFSGGTTFYNYLRFTNELTRTTDIGTTWSTNLNVGGSNIVAAAAFSNSIFMIETSGQIKVSNDRGDNWNAKDPGVRTTDIAISPSNPLVAIALNHPEPGSGMPPPPPPIQTHIVRTTDGGLNWTNLGNKIAGLNAKVTISQNAYIYVSVDNFSAQSLNVIFRSTDGGNTFTQTGFNSQVSEILQIRDIKCDPDNKVYVATNDGLYISSNNGTTFTRNNLGMAAGAYETPSVNVLAIKNANEFFVGLDGDLGVYRTSNGGVKWDSLINTSIVAKDIRGMAVNTAGDVLFSTNSIYKIVNPAQMGVPTLATPNNNVNNIDFLPELTWNLSSKADMYEFQISDDRFYGLIQETSTQAAPKWKITRDLAPNTKYYWRTRGKANASLSTWSTERSFTTKLAKPVLLTPTNLKRGVKTLPTFTWNKTDGADSYILEVAEKLDFATKLFTNDKLTDTITTINVKLKTLTTYYWRVRAIAKNGNTSDFSEAFEFFTVLPPPSLVSPKDKSAKMPIDINFTWTKALTSEDAWIEVGSSPDLKTGNFYVGKAEELTGHFLFDFEFNKTYYWRTYASNEDGVSDYSETWSFTTTIPGVDLLTPSNKDKAIVLTPTLTWKLINKATRYKVQLAKDSLFTNLIYTKDSTELNNVELTDNLEPFTTYYWRVQTYVQGLVGEWSKTWSFRTELPLTTLTEPALGDSNQIINSLYLRWQKPLGALKYDVRVDTKNTFDTPDLVTKNDWDFVQFDLYNLKYKTIYYWSVRSINGTEKSAWSETWYFTTKPDPSSVIDDNGNFEIDIFPNPTQSLANISFKIKENAEISYDILSVTGSLIESKNLGYFDKGNVIVPMNTNTLASGTYLVQFKIISNGKEIILIDKLNITK